MKYYLSAINNKNHIRGILSAIGKNFDNIELVYLLRYSERK